MADLDSLIDEAPTKKKAKKTTVDSKPAIVLTDELKVNLRKFIYHKEKEKTHKGEKEANEKPVNEFCFKEFVKNALAGNYASTYKVEYNEEGETNSKFVNYVVTDKFSVSQENISQIKELVGNKFETLFEKEVSVYLKPEVLSTPELKDEIKQILGDKFSKFFASEVVYSTKEGFSKEIFTLGQDKSELIRKYAVQNKPYFK